MNDNLQPFSDDIFVGGSTRFSNADQFTTPEPTCGGDGAPVCDKGETMPGTEGATSTTYPETEDTRTEAAPVEPDYTDAVVESGLSKLAKARRRRNSGTSRLAAARRRISERSQ